jgi:hypothetical protein
MVKDKAESIKVGDLLEIVWDDVQMEDRACLVDTKPPFNFDATHNVGVVVYRGKKIRKDWLIISSELPEDPHSPSMVQTAFPPGVLSTARIRIIERKR